MQNTPKGMRLQIGVFGARNAGKSSLLNRLAGQQISIVSDVAGTTTDPIEKAMELQPVGPVLLIDTAGLDDEGALGEMRVEKSRKVLERTDLALIVSGSGSWNPLEKTLAEQFSALKIPFIAVFNKSDCAPLDESLRQMLEEQKIPAVSVSALTGEGFGELRAKIIGSAPEDFLAPQGMLPEFINGNSYSVLVTPVDIEAPKGRLILPQVQAIRDALDRESWCVVTKENRLAECLQNMVRPPDLVVTDSQMFGQVSKIVPESVPLTSFSILLARQKADLAVCASDAAAIDSLKDGSRVLIAEACTHHPVGEDIGTVKIPAMLRKKTGKNLQIEHSRGHDFPADLSEFSLVIHCGACMFNRREVLTRMEFCREKGVPFTNYGVCLAHCAGILERALRPFPGIYESYCQASMKR